MKTTFKEAIADWITKGLRQQFSGREKRWTRNPFQLSINVCSASCETFYYRGKEILENN